MSILIISLVIIAAKLIIIKTNVIQSITSLQEEYIYESFGFRFDQTSSNDFLINTLDTLFTDLVQLGVSIIYFIFIKVVLRPHKNPLSFKRKLTRFLPTSKVINKVALDTKIDSKRMNLGSKRLQNLDFKFAGAQNKVNN